jgi:hypothetical protein
MFKAFKENQAQTSADGSDSTTNTAVAMRELQKHPAFAEMYSGVYNDRVLPGVLLLQVSTQTELAAMLVLEATWKRCGIPIESRSAERAEWKPLVNQSEEDSNDHPACTTPPAALQFVLGHKSWQRLLKEMPDRPAYGTEQRSRLIEKDEYDALWAEPSSQHRGVHWVKARGKWAAQIRIDGKQRHLGRFADEEQAAAAYREAAVRQINH